MGKVGGPKELKALQVAAAKTAKAFDKLLDLSGSSITVMPTGSRQSAHPYVRIHIEHPSIGDLGEIVLDGAKKFSKHVQLTTSEHRAPLIEAFNTHFAPTISKIYTVSAQKAKIPKSHKRIKVGMKNLQSLFESKSKEWVRDLDFGDRHTGVGIHISSTGSRKGIEHHDIEWTIFEKVGLFDRQELYCLDLHFDADENRWIGSVSGKHPLHEDQFDTLLKQKILPALKTVIDTKITIEEHLPHHCERLTA